MYTVTLTDREAETVRQHARLAALNGRSNVRTNDRESMLMEDQVTAQLGEAALSKLLTGSIHLYVRTREEREKDPYQGDNGSDLLGYRVDVKTSRMRFGMDYPYHLWVREKEYQPDTLYFLALLSEQDDLTVYFAGTILGKDIPSKSADRYEACMEDLKPIGLTS